MTTILNCNFHGNQTFSSLNQLNIDTVSSSSSFRTLNNTSNPSLNFLTDDAAACTLNNANFTGNPSGNSIQRVLNNDLSRALQNDHRTLNASDMEIPSNPDGNSTKTMTMMKMKMVNHDPSKLINGFYQIRPERRSNMTYSNRNIANFNINGLNRKMDVKIGGFQQVRCYNLDPFGKATRFQDFYEVGQTFLHREYAYRGIIMDSWAARVYNNPVSEKSMLESNFREELYYKVLRDIRDDSKEMKSMRVLSYVPHSSILPFTPLKPLVNGVIDYFFKLEGSGNKYVPTDNYERQITIDHAPLARAHVYRQATNGILIQVIPIFDTKTVSDNLVWRYHVRIANHSAHTIQLKKREWEISVNDSNIQNVQIVHGDGVVGKCPIILPGERFEYESWTPRLLGAGWMKGYYIMLNKDTNKMFQVAIPKFWLFS